VKGGFRSVADYLAAQPPKTRAVLRQVRAAIRKGVPGADEVISYSMPAYKKDGAIVLYFAGWKAHYSLYPMTATVVAAFGDAVARYERSKGTIRFPLDEPVPSRLITRLAKFRAAETAERVRAARERAAARRRSARTARS
jgi:uncharacterized protein YdhG (YjbR/CyaY superfamily)